MYDTMAMVGLQIQWSLDNLQTNKKFGKQACVCTHLAVCTPNWGFPKFFSKRQM